VDREHVVELLVGIRLELVEVDDAGVVDHDIDAAERVERRLNDRLGSGLRADVPVVADRGAACGRDVLHDLVGHGPLVFSARADPVVDHDGRAALSEQHGVCPPEPAAGPGDDGDPPLQPQLVHALTAAVAPPSTRRGCTSAWAPRTACASVIAPLSSRSQGGAGPGRPRAADYQPYVWMSTSLRLDSEPSGQARLRLI
jgi:hypothetical protein